MNEQEYLFVCLSEELSECQKEIAKILRFGLDDYSPFDETKTPNIEKLQVELAHAEAVRGMLFNQVCCKSIDRQKVMREKIEKVKKYYGYSIDRGCLK